MKRLRSPRAVPRVHRPDLLVVVPPPRADRVRGARRPPDRLAPLVTEVRLAPPEIEVLAVLVGTGVPARRVTTEVTEVTEVIDRRVRR